MTVFVNEKGIKFRIASENPNVAPIILECSKNMLGCKSAMKINTTLEQLERWKMSGELIQNAFPELDVDSREFLLSGITPSQWERMIIE